MSEQTNLQYLDVKTVEKPLIIKPIGDDRKPMNWHGVVNSDPSFSIFAIKALNGTSVMYISVPSQLHGRSHPT